MKLDNHLNNTKEKIELSVEKRQEKEKFIFTGVLKPHAGQRVFELDMRTMTVMECEYFVKTDTVNYLDVLNNAESLKERNILIQENCDYAVKLNMENAIKHFPDILQRLKHVGFFILRTS
jgi:hypothetical protein